MATTARLNNALKRLGSGWALFVEAERRPAAAYAPSTFPEALSWLVDESGARRLHRRHFESGYFLTLGLSAAARIPRASRAVDDRIAVRPQRSIGASTRRVFTETDRFSSFSRASCRRSRGSTTRRRLAYCIRRSRPTGTRDPTRDPVSLGCALADCALTGGLAPRLGDQHLRILTVRGFPTATWPGLLDELNRLGFSYRWVTRFCVPG